MRDLLKSSLLLIGHRRADEIVERDRRALAEGPEHARAGECEPDLRLHVPLAGDVAGRALRRQPHLKAVRERANVHRVAGLAGGEPRDERPVLGEGFDRAVRTGVERLDRRCDRRRVPLIQHALARRLGVNGLCRPTAGRGFQHAQGHAGRRTEIVERRQAGRIVRAVIEEALLRRCQIFEVGLHLGDVGLLLRVGELRDRYDRENPDDHHHDQQLDQGETA